MRQLAGVGHRGAQVVFYFLDESCVKKKSNSLVSPRTIDRSLFDAPPGVPAPDRADAIPGGLQEASAQP